MQSIVFFLFALAFLGQAFGAFPLEEGGLWGPVLGDSDVGADGEVNVDGAQLFFYQVDIHPHLNPASGIRILG